MQQKFSIGFCTFSYGGNGGISSEVPDIREWMLPAVSALSQDSRVSQIQVWNLSDTPITMTRNRAVLMAREYKVDVLVMVDSDMKPDLYTGQPGVKPFLQSSFDYLVEHYHKGPVVIGAPYCGPPPHENVYVFRWQAMQSHNANPDFKLEMYDRDTGAKMSGIQECAALPTGLIMYDMRAFEVTEPKDRNDNPWFYYEYPDKYQAEKASTEDVTMTRDLSLAGTQKLGYNPVLCNWDAWAGHWKPKCVGKPQVIQAVDVSDKLKQCWTANYDAGVKVIDVRPSTALANYISSATPPDELDRFVALSDGTHAKLHHLRSLMDAVPLGQFVEVGNREGGSLIMGLQHKNCWQMIGIDPYGGLPYTLPGGSITTSYDDEMYNRMRRAVMDTGMRGKLSHYKLTSAAWISAHPNAGPFSFVYLDGRHDKETVDMEIEYFSPRMAPGGIICVDDVSMIPDVDLSGWDRALDMASKRFDG